MSYLTEYTHPPAIQIDTQEKLRLNLHSLSVIVSAVSVDELLKYVFTYSLHAF